MKRVIRVFIWLLVLSLFIPGTLWRDAMAQQRGQRNNRAVTARLVVQIQYEQEDNSQTADIRTSAKLNLKLSYTRGVQFSSVPNPGGSVDILDLPNAPASAQGAINYSSQSESHSNDTSIFGSGTFAGNYKTPDAFVSAFWAEEQANALDIRLESHGELTGDCHEDITSNGKTQRTDDCADVPGADTGLIELDKFQPNKEAQTPDAKFKTKLRFNFDVIAAPTQETGKNAYLDYNDTTWRGGQTKGDAKAGYKVEFDGFKQFQQPNLSGKKHLILSAQIVPGSPTAAVNGQELRTSPLSEDTPAFETKKFVLPGRGSCPG
jgi:hypothetical protein